MANPNPYFNPSPNLNPKTNPNPNLNHNGFWRVDLETSLPPSII